MFSPRYPKAPLLANFQKVNVLIPNSTLFFPYTYKFNRPIDLASFSTHLLEF